MFPASWDPTHAVKKRRRTFLDDTEAQAARAMPPVPFQSDLQQTILRRLNATEPPPPTPELRLDHILSRVPYRAMLENLFPAGGEQVPDVPILCRSYEESFMRQPLPGERPCAMGDLCECMFIDKASPFVGAELRLPHDPPDAAQLCVVCSRAATQKCFYDMCFLGRPAAGVIQRYGCIYGQPGEYAAECVLIPPRALGLASMPAPSVSHQRNRYTVTVLGGLKHLKQARVSFEDFRPPSSPGAACSSTGCSTGAPSSS
jgi:hypothetical protein